jgi:hypothetical protein
MKKVKRLNGSCDEMNIRDFFPFGANFDMIEEEDESAIRFFHGVRKPKRMKACQQFLK